MTLSGFGPMNLPAHLSLSGMTLSLCVTIIVPFAGAFLTRKAPPSHRVYPQAPVPRVCFHHRTVHTGYF